MMSPRRDKRPSLSLSLGGALVALALVLAACSGGDDTNGSTAAEGTHGSPAENGQEPEAEASPTPKTEEELEEIEKETPLEKKACTATAKLKSKRGRSKIQLTATDNAFDPQCPVGFSLGNLVKFTITNDGETTHNFSAPARGIDFDVEPGGKQVVRMAMGNEKIPFFCKYHADQGMRGAVFPGKPPKPKDSKDDTGGSGEKGENSEGSEESD